MSAQSQAAANVTTIVLAAGQGTRMKSARPKVLFELAGRSMVDHVITSALDAGARDVVVVVGFGRDEVVASLAEGFGERVRTAIQEEPRGTGHAVLSALPAIAADAELALLLCGDTPLLSSSELRALVAIMTSGERRAEPLAMLTCRAPDPKGYGRILRDAAGRVVAIREHRDCTEAELAIDEVNPGVYLVSVAFLRDALRELRPNNAQGELYLTDIVRSAAERGGVIALEAADASALVGVNDRAQLADAEDALYRRHADALRRAGATIRTSARVDVTVRVEADAVIEHGVVLRGATRVGRGARVDVGSVLTDVVVHEGALVKPYSVATQSSIGPGASVGPFAHLRPESELQAGAHIGNFVETKKTIVREGAKANHLAYLGDSDIGAGANIGAGTIFCNYDGFRKHRTEIGAGAFIGSDSQLVAPVRVGAGAYVATGTTVTRDVPDEALAIARVRQDNKEGYATRLKGRLGAKRQG
jgi:bifunctional UDP-N-acetylglucosamine pyrophosphorylase/glucosamine-1-phosphate N-acetyltransferase